MHISEEAFRLLNDKFADALIKLDEAQARIKKLEDKVSLLQDVNHQQFAEAFPEFNKLAWRIKELEEALHKINDSITKLLHSKKAPSAQYIGKLRTTARNALKKESEG